MAPRNTSFCQNCGTKLEPPAPTPLRQEAVSGARKVKIGQMLARVLILPSKTDKIQITIGGDEEIKQIASVELTSGYVLEIKAPLPLENGQTAWMGESSSISMNNGQMILDGQFVDMNRLIDVAIEVPTPMRMQVEYLIGKAIIRGVEVDLNLSIGFTTEVEAEDIGDLQATMGGVSRLLVLRSKNVTLQASGSSLADIRQCTSNCLIAGARGAASIDIHEGSTQSAHLSASGAASVNFHGVAQSAALTASGAGSIYLKECLSRPSIGKSRAAQIQVDRYPQY